MKKRPNFLLITVDQMRGDCLGIAGHPDVKTPVLDDLAAKGTLFSKGYTATPSCIPARAALLTGRSQKKHGRVGYKDGIEWNYKNTFPKVFSENGYDTVMVGKMHVHPPQRRCGFNQVRLHDGTLQYYRDAQKPWHMHQAVHDKYLGFLKQELGEQADLNDTGIECNSWYARPWPYPEETHPTNWVVSESIDYLKRRDRTEPFFLMSSFVRPHPPWDAPQAFFDMYRDKNLRTPAKGDWAPVNCHSEDRRKSNHAFTTEDEELIRQGLIGYYACITHIDHQIGRLLLFLRETGELENTVILFTADHGEILFDHSMFRKVQGLEGSVHVPFILKVGDEVTNIAGNPISQTDALVELRDIAPTLLEIAGITIPEEMDGISILPSLTNPKEKVREYLHGEHSGGELSNHYIVTENDKYIWYSESGIELYFNLKEDPREEKNLVKDKNLQERIEKLRSYLITELTGREEGYTDGEKLLVGKKSKTILSFLENAVGTI